MGLFLLLTFESFWYSFIKNGRVYSFLTNFPRLSSRMSVPFFEEDAVDRDGFYYRFLNTRSPGL